jgi:hypothetical protein
MKNVARGTFAVIIVAAVFALLAWLCGAIILPNVLKDPGVRWTVATAAAIAVDALVAVWAYSFGKRGENNGTGTVKTGAGRTKNSIKRAVILGPVTQGHDITRPNVTEDRHNAGTASHVDQTEGIGSGNIKNSIADAFIYGATTQGRDINQAVTAGSAPEEPTRQEK